MQVVKYPHHLLIIPVWGKCSAPCRIHLPSARIGLLNNHSFFRRLGRKAWKDNRQCLNFPCLSHSHYESSFYFCMITNSEHHLFYLSYQRLFSTKLYSVWQRLKWNKTASWGFPITQVWFVHMFISLQNAQQCSIWIHTPFHPATYEQKTMYVQKTIYVHQRDCLRNKMWKFKTVKS